MVFLLAAAVSVAGCGERSRTEPGTPAPFGEPSPLEVPLSPGQFPDAPPAQP